MRWPAWHSRNARAAIRIALHESRVGLQVPNPFAAGMALHTCGRRV